MKLMKSDPSHRETLVTTDSISWFRQKEGKCKKDILTNCPSSIPMTQARSARGCTSFRRLAGIASIVFLKMDGREKTFQTDIRIVLPVAEFVNRFPNSSQINYSLMKKKNISWTERITKNYINQEKLPLDGIFSTSKFVVC